MEIIKHKTVPQLNMNDVEKPVLHEIPLKVGNNYNNI